MELKGSQTERNLLTAFAGESQARNRYTFYASQAKKEGLVQISSIFEETADQEKEHAKRLFKFLAAASGEHYEHTEMYPGFADVARKEGFDAIATVFEKIAVAEKQHEKRYRDLAGNIQTGRVFKRDNVVIWRCRNCGYLHEGTEAPDVCPACAHPQAHFELLGENW